MTRSSPLLRTLLRWLGLSLLLGSAMAAVLSAHRGATLAEFATTAAISSLYSASIGLPAMLVFPRLRPRIFGRPELSQWLIYLGTLLVITVVGILVAGLLLVAVGVATFDAVWSNYFTGVQIALAVSVPVTIGAATYAKLHHQLARTEASLHAKELEHQKALALVTEARLASLESRVRPHFLFNALNSAIALIPEDPARAEKVLERLAHLLRVSLDTAASTVALGEEIRIATDYLEIERVRFGDRLRYEIDVPEALRGALIPVFAVQTVVENSVKYAVSARKAGARIRVRARRDGDRLRLDITDDGPGFTGPIWRTGHGLDGLRSRLFALYGPAASVVAPAEGIASPEGAAIGAAVTIELPYALPEARSEVMP
jgi:two-component system, LytTR family, sensor histidine kinase AlgZ